MSTMCSNLRDSIHDVKEKFRKPVWAHIAIALPSIILFIWAAFILCDIQGDVITVSMMLALAVAFINEERVRFKHRKEMFYRNGEG